MNRDHRGMILDLLAERIGLARETAQPS